MRFRLYLIGLEASGISKVQRRPSRMIMTETNNLIPLHNESPMHEAIVKFRMLM